MPKGKGPKENAPLIHLSMTFDAARQSPNRFARDPHDPRRPDSEMTAPEKPMSPEKVGQLIVQGNVNYARFIRRCKTAADTFAVRTANALPIGHLEKTYRIFLNKDQIGTKDSHVKQQEPYAAVLSCIDARVPPEMITGQAANDMFAIRTAGNILLERGEARGSLEFVLNNYATRPRSEKRLSSGANPGVSAAESDEERPLSAVLVLGHTQCGALKAAYKAVMAEQNAPVLAPEEEMLKLLQESAHPSLDAIVDRLKSVVRIVKKLRPDIADPEGLLDRVCHFNTMLNYLDIKRMASRVGLGEGFEVYYGSYHVEDCVIRNSNLPGNPLSDFVRELKREEAEMHPLPEVLDSLKKHWSAPETDLGIHTKEFVRHGLIEAMMHDADEFAAAWHED